MPIRTIPLATDQYYHIYNRGVARQPAFLSKRDYERFYLALIYYRVQHPPFKLSRLLQLSELDRANILNTVISSNELQCDILCYCLMPNHIHILVKQRVDNGISLFLSRLFNSYTKYFNTTHERVGPVFQGTFKAVRIESDEQLIHVSRYIHLNPVMSYLIKKDELLSYLWSSLREYMSPNNGIISKELILNYFKSKDDYLIFIKDQIDYAKKLKEIKHEIIEDIP